MPARLDSAIAATLDTEQNQVQGVRTGLAAGTQQEFRCVAGASSPPLPPLCRLHLTKHLIGLS